jgi:hypothetical protein
LNEYHTKPITRSAPASIVAQTLVAVIVPVSGRDETPYRKSARPGDSISMPMKSNDSEGSAASLGSAKKAYTRAIAPIGTLIRKIQCQLAASISQPPRMGPPIGPSSIGMPRTAIRRPIRCGPAARVMIVMPSGMSMPPPRPCRTRKPISVPIESAVAQSAEPSVKSSTASM